MRVCVGTGSDADFSFTLSFYFFCSMCSHVIGIGACVCVCIYFDVFPFRKLLIKSTKDIYIIYDLILLFIGSSLNEYWNRRVEIFVDTIGNAKWSKTYRRINHSISFPKNNYFPMDSWVTSGIRRVFLSLERSKKQFFLNKMNSLLCNFNTTIAITCQYNLYTSTDTWVSVHACTHTTTIHITPDKFKTILTVIFFRLSL